MLIQVIDLNVSGMIDLNCQRIIPDFYLPRHPELTTDEYLNICKALKINSNKLIVHSKEDVANILHPYALHMRFNDYLNKGKLYKRIGVSVHTLEELRIIEQNGDVDYIFLSPIHATQSKPGVVPKGLTFIDQAREIYSGIIIALGGINHKNIKETKIHADGIAAIRYFLDQ